jgi:hypothetical protein
MVWWMLLEVILCFCECEMCMPSGGKLAYQVASKFACGPLISVELMSRWADVPLYKWAAELIGLSIN